MLTLVGGLQSPLLAFAVVVWDEKQEGLVYLAGPITQDDVHILRQNPRIKRGQPIVVELNSSGGDWNAALEIGRELRKSRSFASVDSGRKCMSACVLILAGAVSRGMSDSAQVGIHRPYSLSNEQVSFEEAQRRYRALESRTRDFLREMNIPDALFDAMVRIPAENMRVLSFYELEQFGLYGSDPVQAEIEDAREARKYGLSRQDYLARKRFADDKCRRLWPAEHDAVEVRLERIQAASKCQENALRNGR
jgi:hypothetical protein